MRRRDRVGGAGEHARPAREEGHDPIPRWVAPALFVALTVVLFRGFIFSDQMLYGSDTFGLGYQARKFFADQLGAGVFPRWNPTILGGTPFIESLAGGDSLYPTSILLLLMEPYRALGWKLVLHVLLAGVGGYLWVRSLGLSRAAALVAGTASLLAPWMVTLVFPGHDGKLFVTALTPFVFLTSRNFVRAPGVGRAAALAAMIGVVIFTTHFQAAYFLFGAVGVYALFEAVTSARTASGEGKGWIAVAGSSYGFFLAVALWGAAIAAVQLLPAVDYVMESSRRTATTVAAEGAAGVAYSSSWSLHPEEIVSLAVPEFVGANVSPVGGNTPPAWLNGTYWGQNPFKLNHEYLGIVLLLLAGLAFAGPRLPRERLFFAGLGAIAVLFTLGAHTPVWRVAYELLPGISLFRAPSIAIFIAGFSAITLAAIGVEHLSDLTRSTGLDRRRALLFTASSAGLLLLLALLASSGALLDVWVGLFRGDEPGAAARAGAVASFAGRGFFFAFLFASALAGLVWAAGAGGSFRATHLVAILVVLVTVDLMRVSAAFVSVVPPDILTRPDPNASFLLDRMRSEPPFRVLDVGGNSQDVTLAGFGIELAGGHHPNDLQRYRELIGMVGSGAPENLLASQALRSALNIRYLIWPDRELGPPPEGFQVVSATESGGQVFESVLEIPTLPRAYVAGRAAIREDEAAIQYMLSENFDPASEVVVSTPIPIELGGDAVIGGATWLERGTNRQTLEVTTSGPGILVVSDNWFPAWRAVVDGVETEVLRVNHTLRGVPIEAGVHQVEFHYASPLLRWSFTITLLAVAAAIAAGLLPYIRTRLAGREQTTD